MENKLIIGSHISMNAPDFFLGSVKTALSNNENAFMFYTGAPQNTIRTPLEKCKITEGLELIKNTSIIDINNIVVHAPYLINLGNSIDEEKFKMSKNLLISELRRTEAFGVNKIVLHPGLHMKAGIETGLNQIVKGLNEVLTVDNTNVTICIETMAGKGSELGITFEEIAFIINNCEHKNRLGVCLDTCHINDHGYDISKPEEVLDEFDRVIGLDYLKVIHLNDSKNIRFSHKDRHENIGYGTIGFDNILKWAYEPRLTFIPKILETPYIGDKMPYKDEIEMIKNKVFNSSLKPIEEHDIKLF